MRGGLLLLTAWSHVTNLILYHQFYMSRIVIRSCTSYNFPGQGDQPGSCPILEIYSMRAAAHPF